MEPGTDSRQVGNHLLGPHVVGKRVVVRRVLPGETGPSGGPAMTDLLGVCTAWGDGVCVIQPETGDPVTIRLAEIVSGKPVPPRPSPRLRVSPRDAQLRALALWPDLETEAVGDWLLRRSPTSRARRASSVIAFGPSGVADDYERVVAFYQSSTGRPIAAVIPDSAEERLFRDRGWTLESDDADTLFQVAGVAQVRRRIGTVAGKSTGLEPITRHFPAIAKKSPPPHVVEIRLGDVASGVAAYQDDWVGFRAVHVQPGHRGQGLARAVMSELLEWGAEQGATTAYLQVLADNAPALGLYEQLGFTTHHAYRYLAPAASRPPDAT